MAKYYSINGGIFKKAVEHAFYVAYRTCEDRGGHKIEESFDPRLVIEKINLYVKTLRKGYVANIFFENRGISDERFGFNHNVLCSSWSINSDYNPQIDFLSLPLDEIKGLARIEREHNAISKAASKAPIRPRPKYL